MKCIETGGEYIDKFAEKGELVYEQIGDNIYINPVNDTTKFTSSLHFYKKYSEIWRSDGGSFVDDGYEKRDIFAVSDCSNSDFDGIYEISKIDALRITVLSQEWSKSEDNVSGSIGIYCWIICDESLSKFPVSYSEKANIEIKETFVPAIRYLTLSKLYEDKDKYLSELNRKIYDYELANLFRTEQNFKEIV